MARIDINAGTRDVYEGEPRTRKKWGRWTVTIEGGMDESPVDVFAEALRRVNGILGSTTDASEYPMYMVKE